MNEPKPRVVSKPNLKAAERYLAETIKPMLADAGLLTLESEVAFLFQTGAVAEQGPQGFGPQRPFAERFLRLKTLGRAWLHSLRADLVCPRPIARGEHPVREGRESAPSRPAWSRLSAAVRSALRIVVRR
jgi:hypothetical protein